MIKQRWVAKTVALLASIILIVCGIIFYGENYTVSGSFFLAGAVMIGIYMYLNKRKA